MRRLLLAFCLLTAGALCACSPARTGTVGNTLTTNTRPQISMTANTPLQRADSGTLWVAAKNSGHSMNPPMVEFSYALFADSAASQGGPVTVSAHALLMRLPDSRLWRFSPDSWPQFQTLPFGASASGDLLWPARLLRVPAEGDWISEMWKTNGREVPEFWLAKRWADTLGETAKGIMEYREPWPDGLDETMMFGESAELVAAFIKRADAAFSMDMSYTGLPETVPAAAMTRPAMRPDTLRLVGDIDAADGSDSDDVLRF
ncbi:DUF4851 domain-containing protein [Desulfovibrio sp. OttesenSCG-928-I05]|nr:DUF4851 domain-containing protein [Desulfovibrio sp. OttesenSCG-928-I05]